MTGNRIEDTEDQALLAFLAAQRDAVLSIVAGLDEEAWHRSVVPSGWTPAGLVEHLSGAELHWFQGIVARSYEPGQGLQWLLAQRGESAAELPGNEDDTPSDPRAGFVSDMTPAEVIAEYRELCAYSDAVLAVTPLSARPLGRHGDFEPPSVRWVVLHMIEETGRHAGHLDIARELLDGQTGLGARTSRPRERSA
jgi:hypothetical protein